MLSNAEAASHTWLLNISNASRTIEEMNLFHFIVLNFNSNVGSPRWLAAAA